MKLLKRAAALCMAAAMAMSLSVTAFAAGNGGSKTLTVTGDTLDDKKVYAVQMFTARVTGSTDSHTFDSYELAEGWLPFFTDTTEAGVMLTDQDNDKDVDADDARAYVENLTGQNLVDFADKAQAWVRSHDGQPAEQNPAEDETFAGKIITAQAEDGKADFTELQPGYYLVYPEGGFTGKYEDGTRSTDAMLVNVPRDNDAVWNIKSTYPTVDKTVEDNNSNTNGDGANGSAQVGETVTFTLTSAVPDMSDYTTFYFAFNDTLSNGLEFVKAGDTVAATDVTVTIGGASVTSGYTVSLQDNVLKVVFDDLKTVEGADTGDAIVVTYKAMITEAAVVGTPALNTVEVEYSNDPNQETTGTSTPDTSKVYTYDIDVNKWAEDQGGITGNLPGAEFILSTSATAPTAEEIEADYVNYTGLIKLMNTDSGTGNEYRVAKPGEISAVTSFTTTATGDITIAGLEAGTYYLHEVAAPSGYNKLKNPVKIEIVVAPVESNDDTTGATLENPVYIVTINGETTTGALNDSTINVENKKGIELPETGSIGTIGLTVAGVAIVLVGVFAPRKKKENQE